MGTEYFTGYTGKERFSGINFSGTQGTAISAGYNSLISDLDLNFDAYNTSRSEFIRCSSANINLNKVKSKYILKSIIRI